MKIAQEPVVVIMSISREKKIKSARYICGWHENMTFNPMFKIVGLVYTEKPVEMVFSWDEKICWDGCPVSVG